MKNIKKQFRIYGQIGFCGDIKAFLGFAPAKLLHKLSFADVLNEDSGEGYQRPPNIAHSRNFRHYINQPNASTIPLTFNLRKELSSFWLIEESSNGRATLLISAEQKSLAQVDCQHRLGDLEDEEIPLAFMAFIGLDLRTEMALFTIINSRAKGLSSSLTDYHESTLLSDLAREAPHLFIARRLNEDPASPWYRTIRYGGETNSGLKRRTSLRMMQKTLQRFMRLLPDSFEKDIEELYRIIVAFWTVVRAVFPDEWNNPRQSLLTKGVGLYSMMLLLSDLIRMSPNHNSWDSYFIEKLSSMKGKVDWTSNGPFANIGGQKGANQAYQIIRAVVGR